MEQLTVISGSGEHFELSFPDAAALHAVAVWCRKIIEFSTEYVRQAVILHLRDFFPARYRQPLEKISGADAFKLASALALLIQEGQAEVFSAGVNENGARREIALSLPEYVTTSAQLLSEGDSRELFFPSDEEPEKIAPLFFSLAVGDRWYSREHSLFTVKQKEEIFSPETVCSLSGGEFCSFPAAEELPGEQWSRIIFPRHFRNGTSERKEFSVTNFQGESVGVSESCRDLMQFVISSSEDREGDHHCSVIAAEREGDHHCSVIAEEREADHHCSVIAEEREGDHHCSVIAAERKEDYLSSVIAEERKGDYLSSVTAEERKGDHHCSVIAEERDGDHHCSVIAEERKGDYLSSVIAEERKGDHHCSVIAEEREGDLLYSILPEKWEGKFLSFLSPETCEGDFLCSLSPAEWEKVMKSPDNSPQREHFREIIVPANGIICSDSQPKFDTVAGDLSFLNSGISAEVKGGCNRDFLSLHRSDIKISDVGTESRYDNFSVSEKEEKKSCFSSSLIFGKPSLERSSSENRKFFSGHGENFSVSDEVILAAFHFKWSLEYAGSLPLEVLRRCLKIAGERNAFSLSEIPEEIYTPEAVRQAAARAAEAVANYRKGY